MKKFLFIVLIGLMTFALAACGSDNAQGDTDDEKETITIDHKLEDGVEVEKNPEKVVVFDFGMLDSMKALDLPVAGVPKDSLPTYLEEYDAEDYEHVGGLKEPDFEAIHAMDPDLIIISTRQRNAYEDFSEIAPTIYVELDTDNYMESFEHNVGLLGKIFDKEDKVQKEVDKVNEQLTELQDKAENTEEDALVVLSNGGKVSAFGPGSRFGMVHEVFGVKPADENVEVAQHGQNVSFEYIVDLDPDYLFVIDRDAVVNDQPMAQETIENKLMENTTAYQEDQIVYLDPNYWYLSGGGIISVSEMIGAVSEAIE